MQVNELEYCLKIILYNIAVTIANTLDFLELFFSQTTTYLNWVSKQDAFANIRLVFIKNKELTLNVNSLF